MSAEKDEIFHQIQIKASEAVMIPTLEAGGEPHECANILSGVVASVLLTLTNGDANMAMTALNTHVLPTVASSIEIVRTDPDAATETRHKLEIKKPEQETTH